MSRQDSWNARRASFVHDLHNATPHTHTHTHRSQEAPEMSYRILLPISILTSHWNIWSKRSSENTRPMTKKNLDILITPNLSRSPEKWGSTSASQTWQNCSPTSRLQFFYVLHSYTVYSTQTMWLTSYKNQKRDSHMTERHNIHTIIPVSLKVLHATASFLPALAIALHSIVHFPRFANVFSLNFTYRTAAIRHRYRRQLRFAFGFYRCHLVVLT